MNTTPARLRAAKISRQALHDATAAANAMRLYRLVEPHGPDIGLVFARHLAVKLPSLVRTEAQEAMAAALDIDPRDRDSGRQWSVLIERAHALNKWAVQCEMPSTQIEALSRLRKILAAEEAKAAARGHSIVPAGTGLQS